MKPSASALLALVFAGPGALLALEACSASVTVSGDATSSASSSGDATSSSTGSASSSTGAGACAGPHVGLPSAGCTPVDPACLAKVSECISLQDNAGASKFALRISDLALTKPTALTEGLITGVVQNGVMLNFPKCQLNGGGTLSWLLSFDTVAGTIKTGGAMPAADPTQGYTFVDQLVGGVQIAPVTLTAPLDASCTTTSTSTASLNLPMYLDVMGSSLFSLAIKDLKFSNVTVSPDHNCIGKYNAAGLDPAGGCLADAVTPTYLDGGQVLGLINLEDADALPIDKLGQSLCVVLSGDAGTYGDGGAPVVKCKRQGGKIVFPGDWCTATNQAATAQCSDAVLLSGAFAASGVKLN